MQRAHWNDFPGISFPYINERQGSHVTFIEIIISLVFISLPRDFLILTSYWFQSFS